MSLQRVTNRPGHWCRVRSACRLFAAGLVFIPLSFAFATLQETGRGGKDEPRKEAAKANRDELGKIKQEEALRNLQRLEARMQKLAARANEREPASGAKLREAFSLSREAQIRESMQQILTLIKSGKLDRAVQVQKQVESDLQAVLDLLLDKELDPRKLLKEIRRLRKILADLDRVIEEETGEQIDSQEAEQAGADAEELKETLARLEDLIRKEKGIEKDAAAAETRANLKDVENRQSGIRQNTSALLDEDLKRGKRARERALEDEHDEDDHDHPPGEPHPGKKDDPHRPAEAGQILDGEKLKKAIGAMKAAEASLSGAAKGGKAQAAAKATEARMALEEAVSSAGEKLKESRASRNFPGLKKEQDKTGEKTRELLEKLSKRIPGVFSPDGGIPGKSDVAKASENMSGASGSLSGGKAGKAAESQEEAVENLEKGREKVEQTLEALQEAFRNQLIAYLRQKFTQMLTEQKSASHSTRSLDLKLRALRLAAAANPTGIDIKDRQLAQRLASRELKLTLVCDDILDVLSEDGTTLVFPEIVTEIQADLHHVGELLGNLQTGTATRMVQKDIEDAIVEILAALEEAAKKPPPPNPNKGRQKKNQNSSAPLLAKSAELKMVRALQIRVNRRTNRFDGNRNDEELSSQLRTQLREIGRKQKEVERLLRRIAGSIGQ